MARQKSIGGVPLVDVAVALVTVGEGVLVVYNDNWQEFTLPMTKRREWMDPNMRGGAQRAENWVDAAARATAPWLGRTLTPDEIAAEPLLEEASFLQSDSDGIVKRYHLQVFSVKLTRRPQFPPGTMAEWLNFEDFRQRRPISQTARHIIECVQALRRDR